MKKIICFMLSVIILFTSCSMMGPDTVTTVNSSSLLTYIQSISPKVSKTCLNTLKQIDQVAEVLQGNEISITLNEQVSGCGNIQLFFIDEPSAVRVYAVVGKFVYGDEVLYFKRELATLNQFNVGDYFYDTEEAYSCSLRLEQSWDTYWDTVIAQFPEMKDYLRGGYRFRYSGSNYVETGIMLMVEVDYVNGRRIAVENILSYWSGTCNRSVSIRTDGEIYADCAFKSVSSADLYEAFPSRVYGEVDPWGKTRKYGLQWDRKGLCNCPVVLYD